MNQSTLERRAAALLEMRFVALARAGKPVTAAYRAPVPVKVRLNSFAQQWT